MKKILVICAVAAVLVLVLVRLQKESGMMSLQRCKAAMAEAKSWTAESISEPTAPSYSTQTTRTKVSCPNDYEYLSRNRTSDNVISEQSMIHTQDKSYVESQDGKWQEDDTAHNDNLPKECGKGPLVLQHTVLLAIIEIPRRKAGKIEKGQLVTIDNMKCQEWSVDFGNEWPQMPEHTVCIDTKTHLPRRLTFPNSTATQEFTGWNSTVIEPPAL